jgi:stage II sporulation SpoE-like protein
VTADTAPRPWRDAVSQLVEEGHLTGPSDLGNLVAQAVEQTGATAHLYLVDHEQRRLHPLPPADGPAQDVDATPAGRTFTTLRPHAVDGSQAGWWVPIVNGTERLGVLRVALPADADPDGTLAGTRLLAGMVGHLVSSKTKYGDDIERIRRTQRMTPAAELLHQMLPPLTFSGEAIVITAVLEPCYDVGGDAFDYAVNDHRARLAVYDAVGKGMRAALAVATAISAIRTTRRSGGDLLFSADAADAALTDEFRDARFVTAVLAELDLAEGKLSYLNAGHPPPVVIRGGKAVQALGDGRRSPLGVEHEAVKVGESTFEPGDRLLLYTDGVTEARDAAGELFGLDRLVELVERVSADDLPLAEVARRLSHAVLEHQPGPPRDDATLVLVEWSEAAARRSVP